MKVDKIVFDAYSREISAELQTYNAEQCKICNDRLKEAYYATPEGLLIKAVQEIDSPTPLINNSVLNSRMKFNVLGSYQSSVIYNKLVIFSVKTDDYEVLRKMVVDYYKEKITKFYNND